MHIFNLVLELVTDGNLQGSERDDITFFNADNFSFRDNFVFFLFYIKPDKEFRGITLGEERAANLILFAYIYFQPSTLDVSEWPCIHNEEDGQGCYSNNKRPHHI
jgi:hypothetical protein